MRNDDTLVPLMGAEDDGDEDDALDPLTPDPLDPWPKKPPLVVLALVLDVAGDVAMDGDC